MSLKVAGLRRAARLVLYFFLFTFLVFGVWEWLQTPFFEDVSGDINMIVWFRLHCTLVDFLILAGGVALVSLFKRGLRWLENPRFADLAVVSALGVAYTAVSEYVNVHLTGDWGYSSWMPLLPIADIGLVPLLQWLFLPSCVLLLLRDHLRGVNPRG
jgi:hypothetical protein